MRPTIICFYFSQIDMFTRTKSLAVITVCILEWIHPIPRSPTDNSRFNRAVQSPKRNWMAHYLRPIHLLLWAPSFNSTQYFILMTDTRHVINQAFLIGCRLIPIGSSDSVSVAIFAITVKCRRSAPSYNRIDMKTATRRGSGSWWKGGGRCSRCGSAGGLRAVITPHSL